MRRHPLVSAVMRRSGKVPRRFFPGDSFQVRRYCSLVESDAGMQGLLLADLASIVGGINADVYTVASGVLSLRDEIQMHANSFGHFPQFQPVVH